MDDLIELTIELVGDLLEVTLKGIENPQKRKWALTIFYSLGTLLITVFLIWGAIAIYLDGNLTGAIVFAAVAVIIFLVFGFFILRRHKKNWKSKKKTNFVYSAHLGFI